MIEEILKATNNQPKEVFRLATVTSTVGNGIPGTIRVKFDGETEPSEKTYAYLDSMGQPEVGARVLMASVGGTHIAIGTVERGVMPYGVPSARKLIVERTIALGGDATGSANFDGTKSITIPVNVLFAASVDNTGTGYTGGIQFRATAANKLEFRAGSSNAWYTLARV